jgi:hypothetical protein
MSSLERALVERDKKIEALEATKAAYADRLTELEDRLINMLQQRVALLEEKMGLEERLADIEKAAIAASLKTRLTPRPA